MCSDALARLKERIKQQKEQASRLSPTDSAQGNAVTNYYCILKYWQECSETLELSLKCRSIHSGSKSTNANTYYSVFLFLFHLFLPNRRSSGDGFTYSVLMCKMEKCVEKCNLFVLYNEQKRKLINVPHSAQLLESSMLL